MLDRLRPAILVREVGGFRWDFRYAIDFRRNEDELCPVAKIFESAALLLFERLLLTRRHGLHERKMGPDQNENEDDEVRDDREEHLLQPREAEFPGVGYPGARSSKIESTSET